MIVNDRNGRLVASFPVEDSDQIMLVTDAGKLIRCPIDDVRIAGRNTQGVRIFKTEESEKVVSVERVPEDGNGNGENGEAARRTADAETGRSRSEGGSMALIHQSSPAPARRRSCSCTASAAATRTGRPRSTISPRAT